MTRKFYDPAVNEPAAAQPTEQMSPAAAMARFGVKNETDAPIAKPIENSISEKKEEPTTVTETPVTATVNETPSTETATQEAPTPTVETVTTAEPQIAAPATPAPTWQEVLKSQQPDTVLKELGIDDKLVSLLNTIKADPKMMAFYEHWANNGDTNAFLREANTDYTKMPAEDVMRHQLKQEYPKASNAAIEAMFQKKIVQAYGLNSEDEAEVETGRLLLEAEAEKHRDDFIAKQQNYLLPKAPEPKQDVQADQEDEQNAKKFEEFQSAVTGDAYTKDIFATNRISIGEGDEKFNYPVNPKELTDILFDSDKWATTLFEVKQNQDGTKSYIPNVKRQMLVAAFMKNPEQFLSDYGKHYKSIGAKTVIAPLENASPVVTNTPVQSQAAPQTPAEAMAKMGKVSWGN